MSRFLWRLTALALLCVPLMGQKMAQAQEELSTVPTARIYPQGHMVFKLETLDPFLHTSVGMQFTDSLYVELQQTAQISSLLENAERLYPALDLKLRLIKEGEYRPEVTLGMQSALGQSRLASEYIVLSKRYKSLDFSGGMAWGKLGNAAHIKNPLTAISSHFDEERPIDSEDDNSPDHWFTGSDVGFFGGVSYQTPWAPLKLNADWSADRYEIEQNLVTGFNAPHPWSVGATVNIFEHMSFHGAFVGGEKIMARLIFDESLKKTATKPWKKNTPRVIRKGDKTDYSPRYMGLTSAQYLLPERALYSSTYTPADLWNVLEIKTPERESYLKTHTFFKPQKIRIRLEEKISLAEEDIGALFRSSAILENINETALGILTGFGLRLNIEDNLFNKTITNITSYPTRQDEVLFAQKALSIDRAYLAKNYSFKDIHTHVSVGYLEEMYAGYGGETLYRPYGKTYAFGIEGWKTYHRDPESNLNLKLQNNNDNWTGYVNAYYEMPDMSTTFHGKIGRYLGGDFGGTISISHLFKNDIDLTGYITSTDEDNVDVFGGTDNTFGGIQMSVPLKYKRFPVPLRKACCDLDLFIEPLGRDTGQSLRAPLPLYKTSEPLSYRHVIQHWDDIRE